MDSSERHKRKRIIRQSSFSLLQLLSVRSLLLCFSFLIFICLLSYTLPFTCSVFHPVLVVSSLSLLSSSTSIVTPALSVQDFSNFATNMKIENWILFPDHVLLLVSGIKGGFLKTIYSDELECIYYRKGLVGRTGKDFGVKKVLSCDEYDESTLILRCPLPSMNHTAAVNLKRKGKNGILGGEVSMNQMVNSWGYVAYAAVLDGDTVVVFVKGLNLRADRESDPNPFTCHFASGNWEKSKKLMVTTNAITAAQEILRCPLPKSMRNNFHGIRVTIGMRPYFHSRVRNRFLMPSVAKISDSASPAFNTERYELCVCTMVWNQASAIREWIMYHSWLGVQRWFIYDNNSNDEIEYVVKELDKENYNVSRHVWPWIKTQEAGFSHCAIRAKEKCSWISFMDVDEYFYFPYSTHKHKRSGYAGQYSLRKLVSNVSSSSSNIGEIRTSCHSFGPSGLSSSPTQGVTVGYTCRLQSPERHKSIIRPDALDSTLLNVVHHFHLRNGFKYLNLPQSTAVINHYKYQVWQVFRSKFYRRVATYVADWRQNQNEGSRDRAPGLGTEAIEPPDWPQKFCEVWDTGLRDFVLINFGDVANGLLPWERNDNF